MQVLVVTRGNRKVKAGPRGVTSDGVATKPFYLHFTPWETDQQDTLWSSFLIDTNKWDELIQGKEVYDNFRTPERALAYFQGRPDYQFACPITGKRFESLAKYGEFVEELKARVENA